MSWQIFALEFQLLNQGGVVFLYKLVERGLLWVMAFTGGVTECALAWRQHSASTPAYADLESYKVE